MLQRLNDFLSTSVSNTELHWYEVITAAFSGVKEILAHATLFVHLKPTAPTSVVVDTSDIAIEAVLQQYIENE